MLCEHEVSSFEIRDSLNGLQKQSCNFFKTDFTDFDWNWSEVVAALDMKNSNFIAFKYE
jgi:hypothetical protein